jgi:hypothetical protein
MVLTLENKLEIVDYIGGVPKYQETFDEVYDHIISALSSTENAEFNIGLVRDIVNEDFGGFEQIVLNETEFEKRFVRTCMGDVRREVVNGFHFPGILVNFLLLFLSYLIYRSLDQYEIGLKFLLGSIYLLIIGILVKYGFTRYIMNQKSKHTIRLKFMSTFLFFCSNLITSTTLFLLNREPIFQVSSNVKHFLAVGLFYIFLNLFFAYSKVYKKRLRILA